MRLIDVNDFLAKLKERHEYIMQDPEVSKRMKWCEAVHYGATTEIIEKMPTIEATPVVHGRWIEVRGRYICSECKSRASLHSGGIGQNLSHYCPNCIAKMDGGVSDG